jgi:hypothetical protein
MSVLPQAQPVQDPTLNILTSSGTCTKKQQREDFSDTTDPNYIENNMKEEI